MIFPEGLRSESELVRFSEELRGSTYLLANMTEFGKTPYIPVSRFQEMGYAVVLYPVSTLRAAMKGVEEFLSVLKSEGSQESYLPRMQSRQDLYSLLKYNPMEEWIYPSPTDSSKSN